MITRQNASFSHPTGDPEPVGPNPQHVYFSVDDLDAARARRASGLPPANRHRGQAMGRAQSLRA